MINDLSPYSDENFFNTHIMIRTTINYNFLSNMLPREDHLWLDKSINIQEFASYFENYINDNLVFYLFGFIRN
jgi:hypothetical protein